MTKNKVIIILSGLLLACLIIIFLIFFFQPKYQSDNTIKNDKIIKKLDKELIIREKKIKELIDNPKIKIVYKYQTIETLKILPDEEKNKLILNLQDQNIELKNTVINLNEIIKNDTQIILELKDALYKTNEELKSKKDKLNDIDIFGMAGLDNKLMTDVYAGVIYTRTLYQNKYFSFDFGGGGAVKVYQNIGGSLIMEFKIRF